MADKIKLFVDDIRPAPEGWQLARTVTDAIRILNTQDVSEVSLDHDISHAVEVNGLARPYPCGETFEPVARFLAVIGELGYGPDIVYVHTANAVARANMVQILKGWGDNLIVRQMGPVKR